MNYNQTVYSIPKGKVNKNESGVECAIREVSEEVGYDISKNKVTQDYLEFVCQDTGQSQRMFIICGVSEDHKFTMSTRFEIGCIQWVQIKDIQRGDSAYVYMNPFIQGLQKYIQYKKQLEKSKVKTDYSKLQYIQFNSQCILLNLISLSLISLNSGLSFSNSLYNSFITSSNS